MEYKRSLGRSWLVCGVAALFFFDQFFRMNLANALSHDLMRDFHLSAAEIGYFSSAYSCSNVCFLLLAGVLLDRFSIKRLLLLVTAVAALATWWFASADTFLGIFASRLIVGACGAFAFLVLLKLAIRWFPANQLAGAMGGLVTFAMAGGFMAQAPLVSLIEHLGGWREAVIVDAWVGFAICLAILLWVKDYPKGYRHEEQKANALPFWAALSKVARNPHNWLGGLVICLLNLPIFIFGGFGIMFLNSVYHLDAHHASYITSALFFGFMVGSPLLGWVSDHFSYSWEKRAWLRKGSRKQPLLLSALLSLLVIAFLLLRMPMSETQLIVLFALMGFISSAQVIGYPYIAEHNPSHLSGTAGGLSSTIIMSGGFVQILFGYLLGLSGDAVIKGGIVQYTPYDFEIALLVLPVAYLASLWCLYRMVETHAKPMH